MIQASAITFLLCFCGNIRSGEVLKTAGTEQYNNLYIAEAAEISSPPPCAFEAVERLRTWYFTAWESLAGCVAVMDGRSMQTTLGQETGQDCFQGSNWKF